MSRPCHSSRPSVRTLLSNCFGFSRSPQPSPRNNSTDRHTTTPPVAHAASQPGAAFEQRGLTSQRSSIQTSNEHPQHAFYKAHDFVIKDSMFVDSSRDNFMASFLKETIPGAEFDSSDPTMPLRCHPGTRLEIIIRCQDFVLNREGRPKIRWVVGAAGVGKSAIMQSIAHDESHVLADIIVGATIFFSINGRQDGTKAITTIAYQLAVKLDPYRSFVQREIGRDPSILRKSLSRQFNKFIVEPFIHQRIVAGSSQLLIIIDGLDECANLSTQRELLGLITDFCIAYPTSPIVWMIASRPEPHIVSFFSQQKVALAYEKEDIIMDSVEAYEDVKRYLHDKFGEVQMASIPLQGLSQWPSENDFFKIVNASGGLFAYASTVVRYISDPDYGDPVPLLRDVLKVIETGANKNIWGRNHPMAQLDALYSYIMSKIPSNIMADTRKLFLLAWLDGSPRHHHFLCFRDRCNVLGMTQNAAYGATHHIRSIARIPGPAQAGLSDFAFFHKSFLDYLQDFERSGFSPDIKSEAQQLMAQCALRILEESPDGLSADFSTYNESSGSSITISWPAIRESENFIRRFSMFNAALRECMAGIYRGEEAFQSLLCLRVLTTCFTKLPLEFPFGPMRDLVFDESRRHEFLEHGILKEVPFEAVCCIEIVRHHNVRLRFRGRTVEQSNPWNSSCQHKREGSWEGHLQDWSTDIVYLVDSHSTDRCDHCLKQFTHHFRTQSKEHLVTVINLAPTSLGVELRFVDPDDGVSEWIYHFLMGEIRLLPDGSAGYLFVREIMGAAT